MTDEDGQLLVAALGALQSVVSNLYAYAEKTDTMPEWLDTKDPILVSAAASLKISEEAIHRLQALKK